MLLNIFQVIERLTVNIYCTESRLEMCLKLNKNVWFKTWQCFNICTSQVLPSWKEEALMNFHAFWRANDDICWCGDFLGNSPEETLLLELVKFEEQLQTASLLSKETDGAISDHFLQYLKLIYSKILT